MATQSKKRGTTAPKVPDSAVVVPNKEVPEIEPTHCVRYIKVDPKHTHAQVVKLGPSTCAVCGYDPVIVNAEKFLVASYDDLDEEGKMIARNVLKKHMERHNEGEIAAARHRNIEVSEKQLTKAERLARNK